MKYIIFFMIVMVTLFVFSCGVILDDTTKLEGTWSFTGAEFYTYNPTLDSFKTYKGTDSLSLGLESPYNGSFFCSATNNIYRITFERSEKEWNRFTIFDGSTDAVTLVDKSRCNWRINSWENALEMSITDTTPDSNFWKNGFSFKNYWPLTTNSTMEWYIKATDAGLDYFSVDVSGDTLHVYSMKGFFTKQ